MEPQHFVMNGPKPTDLSPAKINGVRLPPAAKKIEPLHGTTTLGFRTNEGVFIAVDSRASQGTLASSWTTNKVLKISKYVLGTMAGGAADCQYWHRNLACQVRLYELQHGRKMPVTAIAQVLANTLFEYRKHDLSVGTMIGGYDGEFHLFYVDDKGLKVEGKMFSIGSGSLFAHGVLDEMLYSADGTYRDDVTQAEGVEIAKSALIRATNRDAGSGGFINVFFINKDGWSHLVHTDCTELYTGEPPKCLVEPDEN